MQTFIKNGHINILGQKFDLKEVDGLVDSGNSDSQRQIILINKNLSPEQKASTIVHEVIEMLNAMLDLNLSHQTICALEIGLFSFIKDNA